MKEKVTSLHYFLRASGKNILVLLIAAFCFSGVIAQNGEGSELGDLTSINWKGNAEFNNSLVLEQSKTAQVLSTPSMQADEIALYSSYQRMLGYVQTNIQAGKTAGEAITLSYERVLIEAPKDAILAYLPEGLLATFVPGLVESLTALPVPEH